MAEDRQPFDLHAGAEDPRRPGFATLQRLAWLAAASTLALVALGTATLSYGAGLSCPDWPLCQGLVVPALRGLVVLEWGHRVGAGAVGLLTLAIAVEAFRLSGPGSRWRRASVVAVVLLLVQAGLGGLTIFDRLSPLVVALHAAVATAFFCLWVVLGVSPGPRRAGPPGRSAQPPPTLAWGAAISAYVTVLFGSYATATGAGLACPAWPMCGAGSLTGTGGGLALLQIAHRALAVWTVVLVVAAAWRYRGSRSVATASALALAAILAQAGLGAALVSWRLAPLLIVAHFTLAMVLLALLTAISAMVWPERYGSGRWAAGARSGDPVG